MMRYRIVGCICLLLIGFLGFIAPQPARAADQVVTDCVNYTGPNVDIPITLDEAVANAVATGGGTITFSCPAGTVIIVTSEIFIPINTVTIDGGNNVTLDANNSNRIAYINPGATLNMQNIVVRNGASTFGGAFYNDGTLSLNNVTVQDSDGAEGGGIYNATGRPLTITNSTFTGNQANFGTATGGAIYNVGTATITNTIFSNNGYSNLGGAIHNWGTVTLSGGSFSNNVAFNNGGAIHNSGTASSQNVTYTNNTCSNIPVVDNGGNTRDSASTGCPGSIALSASATCIGANLQVTITGGDIPLELSADSGVLQTGFSTGILSLTGPLSETNLTLTELAGDTESLNLGNFTCHNALTASATCISADLQVTISNGDALFQVTADSGTLLTGLAIGTHTITGPVNETNVNVTELGGNTENLLVGDFNCFVSNTLTATAVCNGANLEITISNGNAPFSISVTDSVGTMNSGGQPLGVYTFTGPDTFTNIGITEDTGDLEVLNLPDVTCTAPIVPVVPAPPVVLSPDLTALGCVLTQNVLAPTAPDNTYCRILMKDGAVVNYSGAVPADLIGLGVIFAVDVYRLQGGQSITEFPNYTQVCLAGSGRLFYLDARQSPRTQIELATELLDGMTCGWIPATGTLVLTK
jgi:hypothetical protein